VGSYYREDALTYELGVLLSQHVDLLLQRGHLLAHYAARTFDRTLNLILWLQ
jgi:hypothetical protein